ncbi:FeoA family protein [Pseudoflavonifractor sp. MSJ-37]|uniref:FeoA family protein n=1 Tax=Pseudoflavonifractor sp. MSJ-37 TaxID=2841531 RepID=UPI001C11120D|nr:FeoA family protein [Pseudoflavonifractor sp. MSJ-37]MBU5436290.1 ferrous iron transport protein A [Pseudoflavonifractor sp. MSJ-37]
MPLNLVPIGASHTIQKICGTEAQRHHLEALGFLPGETINVLSRFNGYYVVTVKGSKIGLSGAFAKLIIVSFS